MNKGFAPLIVMIIVVVVGLAAYFGFVRKSGQVAYSPSPTTTASSSRSPSTTPKKLSSPSATSEVIKAYQNIQSNFEFGYPANFSLNNGDVSGTPTGSFLKKYSGPNISVPVIVTVELNYKAYPSTNFLGSWVAVASESIIHGDVADDIGCYILERNGSIKNLPQIKVINGITWHTGVTGGVAAGTTIESRVYHALRGTTCYEVNLHLASSNSYAENSNKSFDKDQAWKTLEDMLLTFKFTK